MVDRQKHYPEKLVLATKNQGKKKEMQALLAGSGVELVSLLEYPQLTLPAETGTTFTANAKIKARFVVEATGHWALSDDSGLVVDALAGAPGVHSARYAGPQASDADNNRKLLAALVGLPREQRQAAFHCAMALCEPSGDCRLFQGRLVGQILEEPRGCGGFGYDPLFLVPEYGQTLAELPLEIKNRISHRGNALREALAYLQRS